MTAGHRLVFTYLCFSFKKSYLLVVFSKQLCSLQALSLSKNPAVKGLVYLSKLSCMKDLISIITPLYNASRFIEQTIRSVISQSYTNWEMIIVDDCSDDGSYEIAQSWAEQDPRVKVFRLPGNSGPAIARNKAIEMAQGRYIAFLDSDDLWMPQKLEKQLMFIRKNDLAFTYTSYGRISEQDRNIGTTHAPVSVQYEDLLKTCPIGCLTVMYDSHALGKQFMPIINKRQDYALWLKLLKITDRAYGLNEVLAEYRVRTESVSSNKFHAASYQWLVYREFEKLPLLKSIYVFSYYAAYGVLNKLSPWFLKV